MTTPLSSFPITATCDPDEAQSVLSRELVDLRIERIRERRSFRLVMNGVHLGRSMLGYNQFDADVWVDPGRVNDVFSFVIGTGPPSIFTLDDEPINCSDHGAIVSPSRRLHIQRPAGGGVLMIRATADALDVRLREVIDRRPSRPLVFDRSVDLASGRVRVRQVTWFIVDCLRRDSTTLKHPLLRAGFDDMLVNALLTLPNNYRDEIEGLPRASVAPGTVRRAEEFMTAHATEAITVSDVVAECGCSRSALHDAFRRFRGYTPMQFLVETRLKSAREALQSPSPNDAVTSIAYACGFAHLGRFSDTYRRRFGESPSETLRRGRLTGDS